MKVTLVKSSNGCVQKQKDNLRSLNLKKIGDYVVLNNTPEIIGRLNVIKHLVIVENEK